MTAVISTSIHRPMPRFGKAPTMLGLAVAAAALTLVLDVGAIGETMRGAFGDPDDAMRLVEVRSWLAGQSWFDMTAARLDPPHGSVLHWSRLVDLPMAAMVRLLGLMVAAPTAERLAAVAVPTLWLVAFYVGMMRLANVLVGSAGRWPALIGTFLSGATLVQFAPGRIGHHAPETVTLVFAVCAIVTALDACRARQAFFGGILVALSLAMSLETLPFHAVLVATIAAMWVWRGEELARALGYLALGLLVGLPVFYLLTVGPDRWSAPTCDAYGAAHLGTGLIGAAGMLAASRSASWLTTRGKRLAVAVVIGACALAFLLLAYPACLRSPFAAVDPLVWALWLDNVVESLPLLTFAKSRPLIALAIILPLSLGALGSLAAANTLRGLEAWRFVPIAALSLAGVALAFWQVRVVGSATPIALCGGVYLASRVARRPVLRSFAILPFCSTVWLIALPADVRAPDRVTAALAKAACLSPEAIAPLATLAPGTAVAPIDLGSHILEKTSLSVFAAPYHRNNDGNRFALSTFLASPQAAEALLAERHVDYLVTCPRISDMRRLAARSPDGLAARLEAGAVPAFLVPQKLPETPYQVYRVRTGK